MTVTAKDVNTLRKMTGAGMMDCKKALTEANSDFDVAIDLLRKKGQKVSVSRAGRATSEGSIFVKTSEDNSEAVLIAFTCETDFVAKNDRFIALGNEIVASAFASKVTSVSTLMNNKIGDLTIAEKIVELVGKIGEKLVVSEIIVIRGEAVVAYIHAGNKLGVLVELKGVTGIDVSRVGKDVGMQIAAMAPIAVDRDQVAQEVMDKELAIGREQAIAEGKPENIVDKIAQGKLNKFFKENTLLNQPFIKNNSLTVRQYLESLTDNLTVAFFKRVVIG